MQHIERTDMQHIERKHTQHIERKHMQHIERENIRNTSKKTTNMQHIEKWEKGSVLQNFPDLRSSLPLLSFCHINQSEWY